MRYLNSKIAAVCAVVVFLGVAAPALKSQQAPSVKRNVLLNNGNTTAKLAVVFVAEKGKPLATKAQ